MAVIYYVIVLLFAVVRANAASKRGMFARVNFGKKKKSVAGTAQETPVENKTYEPQHDWPGTDNDRAARPVPEQIFHHPSQPGDIPFGLHLEQTLSESVSEAIIWAYQFYSKLLTRSTRENPITIVCGGQSPSYYVYAMMQFNIYDPSLVDVVILPHSKGGQYVGSQSEEDDAYKLRLIDKSIRIRPRAYVIDGVHSGCGIQAFESALKRFSSLHQGYALNIQKIAVNHAPGISKIPVDEEHSLRAEPKFSDVFPRLVHSFHPCNFETGEFITDFIHVDKNRLTTMIRGIIQEIYQSGGQITKRA